MHNKEINEVFKEFFIIFMRETMRSCDVLVKKVEKCKTYGDLSNCLHMNANHIADHLGYECDECEDKDYEIKKLSRENNRIDNLLFSSFVPKTLDDVYKMDAFIKAKDNFTVSEFESLMS